MEHWWNKNGQEKPQWSIRILLHCSPSWTAHGLNHGSCGWIPETKLLGYFTALGIETILALGLYFF